MIVEYIRYTVADKARREQLVSAYHDAAKALNKAPECMGYELTLCEEDEISAILRIEWESTEAHLRGFRASETFKDFFRTIGGFVKEIAEMRHYKLTDVASRKQR